ncbi:E3 ubiquitin-protein ligase UHRF1 isoform X2 [Strongylocentrotus purpuratus]|uniref:RING-type E3 ubiquitin transferase n=1 Tax=Strongylocentrotus purpuratus TaxID=7668 RepID=A0A7M7T424_STRPU|nr:E3 ubiquitin-protein ligase UHRF1 isoform X2 [Strongylocentrotus purpuratus]
MWVIVRTFDCKKTLRIDGLSKLTKIEQFRERLVEDFNAPVDRQRLFFSGKELVDGHTLFDYRINLNDTIQLMMRAAPVDEEDEAEAEDTEVTEVEGKDGDKESEGKAESGFGSETSDSENVDAATKDGTKTVEASTSQLRGLFKVGDVVDGIDMSMGAWFEADIVKITEKEEEEENEETNNNNESETKAKDEKALDQVQDKPEKMDQNENEPALPKDSENEKNVLNVDAGTPMDTECNDPASQRTCGSDESILKEGGSGVIQIAGKHDSHWTRHDGLIYHVKYEGYDEEGIAKISSRSIRPRARTMIDYEDVTVGDIVMVNYNCDEPKQRGYWYDMVVKNKKETRSYKELAGDILLGPSGDVLKDCKVRLTEEIFKTEKVGESTCDAATLEAEGTPVKRTTTPNCAHCKDNPRRKCKHCACHMCGNKEDDDKTLLCDECDMPFHIYCLDPPMESIPDVDEWYCPLCKNDASEVVMAGQKLKASKKKSKMASATSTSQRDWGKGMACQGRSKVCTIVPPNHFGAVPGIHVGQLWRFRVQVSEAGVHRPHVAGIHGREIEGAYSIVLAGGYEDDLDNGDEFYYTGSGGRDLSGNKRTAEQSHDQKLAKMNMALARNCNAPTDKVKGNEAKDWKAGKPVRVVRNAKGRKHSKYAPEDGNRYDGIYKIVKYWPEKGKSGFLVWRYLIRRDDPSPAPWSKAGKKKIKELGLEIEYPDGYLEVMAAKEAAKEKEKEKEKRGLSEDDEEEEEEGKKSKKGKGKKRQREEPQKPTPKKPKFELSKETRKMIDEDEQNKSQWKSIIEECNSGKKFITAVEDEFTCICCQEVVYQPISTPCSHNLCKSCIQRSFKAEIFSCPHCRYDLGKGYSLSYNKNLQAILLDVFPGYDAGR